MDEKIKEIENWEKAREIADNIFKAIEPFLSEIKRKNEYIKELEEKLKCSRISNEDLAKLLREQN